MQKVKGLSRLQIRDYVKLTKKFLGIDGKKRVDVIRLLEVTLFDKVPDFELIICSREELGDEEGRTFPEQNRMMIREDVYERAIQGSGRDRFTIIHEIAHLFLHDGVVPSFARSEDVQTYEDPEWQADCFAGEFLMPLDSLRNLEVGEIVDEFGVSFTAASFQKRKSNDYYSTISRSNKIKTRRVSG